jgi:hypothetical protein
LLLLHPVPVRMASTNTLTSPNRPFRM